MYLQRILTALGHPQGPTLVKTYNGTAAQFVHDTIKNKGSKSWDVRYRWLTEHQATGDFDIYWDSGKNNLADYHTKHHNPTHHQNVRKKYVLQNFLIKKLQVEVQCVIFFKFLNNDHNHQYARCTSVHFRCTAPRGCAEDLNGVVSVRKYDARTTHDAQTN